MANTRSTIEIIFEGAVSGLQSAASIVEHTIGRVNRSAESAEKPVNRLAQAATILGKGFVALGAGAASVQATVGAVAGLAAAAQQLAPAALALPGIFLGIGVAVGTAKLALLGVGDAIKGDAEALAKLSPAARDTVGAIRGLEGGFNKLKAAVQEDFFAGLAFDIKATGAELLRVGTIYLPEVASGFNAMAVEALRAARAPKFLVDLGVIAENTAIGLANMKNALANVISGFVGLGAIGSKFLPAIGKAIDDVARRFNDWVQKGINDGSIEAMIDRAIQGFRDLGATIGNAFTAGKVAIEAFNRGLGGEGGTLATLREASAALLEFVNRPEVQAGLQQLGENIRVVAGAFRDVLGVAVRELGPVFVAVAPFVQALVVAIRDNLIIALELLGPVALRVAEFLSRNKDVIIFLVPVFLALKAALGVLRVAMLAVMALRILAFFIGWSRILAGVSLLMRGAALAARVLLGPLLLIAGIVGLAIVADQLNEVNKAAVGGDVSKLGTMESTLNNLVEAGRQLASGDFAGIFADIGSEWDTLVQKFQTGESPAGAAFQKIAASFQNDLVTPISTAGAKIGESFQRDFVDVFANLPSTIATAAQPVIDFFANLPTLIGTALGDLGSFFVTKATEIWNAFLDGCTSAFAPVLAFFQQTPAQMGFAIGAAIGDFITAAINLWNAFLQGCQTGIAAVIAFCAALPGRIIAAIAGFISMVAAWATTAWNGALAATTAIVGAVIGFCAALPGRIMSAINGFIAQAINWARQAWTGVQQTTTSVVSAVISFVGQIPGRIMSFLASLPGQLRSNATTSWNGFRDGVTSVANQVISFVGGIPGRIMSALGNLGSLLLNAGRSVIDGLLAGIRAGVQAMYDFVSGIAAGIAARKGPIEKDRVLLKPAGLALMQGLQGGLETGASKVLTFVSGLGPAMAAVLGGTQLGTFEAAQLARVQSQSAARGLLGTAVNQVTAVASREQPAPVTNVTVLLSREQIAEIARVVVDNSQRETARKVTAGFGTTF